MPGPYARAEPFRMLQYSDGERTALARDEIQIERTA
jgi:hypothetical protein